ncbi:HSP20-like chaperone [Laetiporus sulphureus 93-53]|uniref:HSP20-like chaperone n=1 Tax=Laetiporus sulphureus 93-53 TaxID=1314785 RepID=A0A165CB20_9APHY|nr:HSP20-like chaperone [Laetiporus sulphureus 93-53]KZT02487.1 HSP20-like chaperone [Laetiporus sulphureus 93-53]
MSLTRFFTEPSYSLSDFDRLFDDAFARRTDLSQIAPFRGTTALSPVVPKMDLHEDAKTNVVTATFELPGLKKEDVNIDVTQNTLTISGESKISSDRDENGYSIRERRYGRFSRSLSLPQGVKDKDIKANMESGVLTVKFPRSTPEQAAKKIPIA